MASSRDDLSGQEKNSFPTPLSFYTAGVTVLGFALLVLSIGTVSSAWPSLLLFLILILISEATSIETLGLGISFSISSAVQFASLLVLGPIPAALVGVVDGLAITLVSELRRGDTSDRAPLWRRASFNMANISLALAGGGAVYLLADGSVGNVARLGNVLPAILAAVTVEITNGALVVGAASLQSGQPALRIWRQGLSWAVPMNLLTMLVGGGGMALGYEAIGPLGGAVFFLPTVLTLYAFRLYIVQSRQQMNYLEQSIAERKRAEQELRVSLEEKEVLLKEIHHRVKNNLQIISALLYLQGNKVEDARARAMFAESENRIKSMSLVHERLYQSPDLARIDLRDYVESLAGYLLRSYRVGPARIKLNVDVEDISLDVSTAVPCGLILNELLSNALKHAFPDGTDGEILINMRTAGDQYRLLVQDNGVGMPESVDYANSESLGLQLVSGLASQLGGEAEQLPGEGTGWSISIPRS